MGHGLLPRLSPELLRRLERSEAEHAEQHGHQLPHGQIGWQGGLRPGVDDDPGDQVAGHENVGQGEPTDPSDEGPPASDEDGAVAGLDLVEFDLSQARLHHQLRLDDFGGAFLVVDL